MESPQRLRVRLTRGWLDRQLARGATCDASPALALRAAQLASPPARKAIAVLLDTVLLAAEERAANPGSPLIVNHDEVIAAREQIVALVERLLSAAVLEPRGVALARLLVRDARSPLFSDASGHTLEQALSEIAVHLRSDPGPCPAHDASTRLSSRNLDGPDRNLHAALTRPHLR